VHERALPSFYKKPLSGTPVPVSILPISFAAPILLGLVALESFTSELLKDTTKAGEKRATTLLNLEEKVRAVVAIHLRRITGQPHFASTRR